MIHFVRVESACRPCSFCEKPTRTTWFFEPPSGGRELLKACDLCVRELAAAARVVEPKRKVAERGASE